MFNLLMERSWFLSSTQGMKYIKKRGLHFHFVRRVPKTIKLIDGRDYIQLSLKTDSPSIVKLSRQP
jgi:hypothetical protein